jgi:predicted RNase H-like HicB family nuclease
MALIEDRTTLSGKRQTPAMLVESGLSLFARDRDLFGAETIQLTRHLPDQVIRTYLREALKRAEVKRLDDGNWFMEIPGFDGVWASGDEIGKTSDELEDVLFEWLVLKIEQKNRDIPIVAEISLNTI